MGSTPRAAPLAAASVVVAAVSPGAAGDESCRSPHPASAAIRIGAAQPTATARIPPFRELLVIVFMVAWSARDVSGPWARCEETARSGEGREIPFAVPMAAKSKKP